MIWRRHGWIGWLGLMGIALAAAPGITAQDGAGPRRQQAPRADLSGRLGEMARPARTAPGGARMAADAGGNLPALLNEAAGAAAELKRSDETFEALGPKVDSLSARLESHNRDQCTYPEDKPDVCKWYNDRAATLNRERVALLAEIEAAEIERRTVMARLQMVRAQLRVQALLTTGCGCDRGTVEEQKACWDRCFDGADPRLRSCLHIVELEAFAACLREGR